MIALAFLAFALVVYLFIFFIVKRDRGSKEPKSALFAAMGFGVIAVILAGILNEIFIPKEVVDTIGEAEGSPIPTMTLLLSTLGVGVIEESLKILPFAFFIYKKKYFNELTDGIIYFGIVALTFGIIEDISYSIEFGGGTGLFRIAVSPYLHVGFTMLFGTALIYKKVFNRPWAIVLFGYMAAIIAHGLYDFFTMSGGILGLLVALCITIALNIMLFVLFRRVQRIDEAQGRSSVGINKFCRHCGQPNPHRLLYCAYCGKLS